MCKCIRQSLLLLCFAIVPAVMVGLWHPNRPLWQADQLREDEVKLQAVQVWSEPVLWLDARSAEAYNELHWPEALLLNEDEWEDLIEPVMMAWEPDMKVVVYCDSRTCDASREVVARLRDEMQWDQVYILHGGWLVLSESMK